MEEIITVDGKQYILTTDQPLTMEQRTQTTADIRKKSGCGCSNKTASLGKVAPPQSPIYDNIIMQTPANPAVSDIKIGNIDCPIGACPNMTCTSIGCTTDTRDIVVRYTNYGDLLADIIPHIIVSKTTVNVSDAIRNGADRLVQTQNSDGTWEWSNPDTDPGTTLYPTQPNVLGVTAIGLVKAYLATGDVSYLNAAKKTADLLVSKTPDGFGPDDPETTGKHKVYGQDITFLAEFADAWARAGNPDAATYSAKANDYMSLIMNDENRFCTAGCSGHADQLVNNYFSSRTPNLYGWDIAGWVEAATKTGNMTFANEIVSYMIPLSGYLSSTATGGYSTGSSYVLGLSGYLRSYILTGVDYSEIMAKIVLEKIDIEGSSKGSFKIYAGTDDGKDQTAAYALIALDLVNIDMTDTINYLVSSQSGDGRWIESDGNEYTEVDSEVIVALHVTRYPSNPVSVLARLYTDVTFNNVELSRGTNYVYADWTTPI